MRNHSNNVGFLRLIFACLVIIGHAPEMTDGNRTHEPLTFLFHSISLGELSVDAFFLLSGYLITQSAIHSSSIVGYFERRVFRIYPAFIVSFLLVVFVLGPIVGAHPWTLIKPTFSDLVELQMPPEYPGQLDGVRYYPVLNGSIWTIAFEFRCYVLLGMLRVTGLLRRRIVILFATSILIALNIAVATHSEYVDQHTTFNHSNLLIGDTASLIRFVSIFMVGSCIFLYSDVFARSVSGSTALISSLIAGLCLYNDPIFAETAVMTFGAIGLFWLAFKADLGPLQTVNDKWDISYGTYLYGWPVATYLRWRWPEITALEIIAITIPVALAFGAASWWGVEKWSKRLSFRMAKAARPG